MVLVSTGVLSCVGTGRYYKKLYDPLLAEKQQVIDLATRYAYVTVTEIRPGECFTKENTKLRCVITEEEKEVLASEVLGKVASTKLPAGVFVHNNQCTEAPCDVTERECIFTDIAYAEGFPAFSMVDVRLRYPNGENYCVLQKKRLLKNGERDEESRLFLTEAEQVLISAARYDRSVYSGAELYYVAFVEELLQGDTESYYVPTEQSIRQLMEIGDPAVCADESWIGLRKSIEMRQAEDKEKRLSGF